MDMACDGWPNLHFHRIKRTFGEHVSSVKWNNIVNEVTLKASIYNFYG